MKKLTFLLVCIYIATNISFAQKLVFENYIWSTSVQGTESDKYITEHTTFKETAEINGISYLKVFVSTTVDPYNWKYTNKLVREENDQVFLYHENSAEEELLYDFSLKQGDTFTNKFETPVKVDSITKQYIGNEELRTFHLSVEDVFPFTWTEKLGSKGNVLDPYNALMVGEWNDLLCLECDGELFYRNSTYEVCHRDNTTSVNTLQEPQLLEFDCSVSGQLTIHNISGVKGKIQVYNLHGQQITSNSINSEITDLCLPQNGPIIYRFESSNGKFQKGKLIVR